MDSTIPCKCCSRRIDDFVSPARTQRAPTPATIKKMTAAVQFSEHGETAGPAVMVHGKILPSGGIPHTKKCENGL